MPGIAVVEARVHKPPTAADDPAPYAGGIGQKADRAGVRALVLSRQGRRQPCLKPADIWRMLEAYAMNMEHTLSRQRRVSLFRNGRDQAVRIPKDMELPGMELPGDEAVLRKEGDRLILEPVHPASLLALVKTLSPIEEGFADIEDPAPVGL